MRRTIWQPVRGHTYYTLTHTQINHQGLVSKHYNASLIILNTCVSEIELLIAKTSKTCQLDPMPSNHVKDNMISLASVITDTTNASLSEGVMPNQLKHALVHPRLKKPSLCRNTLNNYRPVSILPQLSKAVFTHTYAG